MQVIHGDIIRPVTHVTIPRPYRDKEVEIRDWIEANIAHAWSRSRLSVWDNQQRYDFRYEKDAVLFSLRWL